ncbi:hypothetical protein Tco_1443129 [Tanacetum coccineum]
MAILASSTVLEGGQYLFRNLVLRISQVVIDHDGWFLSHLLAAPVRDTGKAPTESIVTKFFEKLPLQFKGGILVDRRPSNARPIRRLDSKTQYAILIRRFDTSYPTGGYGVSVGNMSKCSTYCSPALGSSLWESSSFQTISINITSPSSSLVQMSLVLDDGGTNPSDSKNELNLRTFLVMNETDGLGGVENLEWTFSGLFFSPSTFTSALPSWGSLCCLGQIVMALIEL